MAASPDHDIAQIWSLQLCSTLSRAKIFAQEPSVLPQSGRKAIYSGAYDFLAVGSSMGNVA